jgi:hypothetical protein
MWVADSEPRKTSPLTKAQRCGPKRCVGSLWSAASRGANEPTRSVGNRHTHILHQNGFVFKVGDDNDNGLENTLVLVSERITNARPAWKS